MNLRTVEGIVENGKIQLPADIHLPDKAKVLVLLPEPSRRFMRSPRLVNPEDASLFEMEVTPVKSE